MAGGAGRSGRSKGRAATTAAAIAAVVGHAPRPEGDGFRPPAHRSSLGGRTQQEGAAGNQPPPPSLSAPKHDEAKENPHLEAEVELQHYAHIAPPLVTGLAGKRGWRAL